MKSRTSRALQYSILCIVEKDFWFYSRLCDVCKQNHSSVKSSESTPLCYELLETRLAEGWGIWEAGKHSSIRLEGRLGMGYRSCKL